jgi:hypothetical protein
VFAPYTTLDLLRVIHEELDRNDKQRQARRRYKAAREESKQSSGPGLLRGLGGLVVNGWKGAQREPAADPIAQ